MEAQAEGTPVLALGRGGALETVIAEGPGKTGAFFAHPEPELVADCVRKFIAHEQDYNRAACRLQAERFSAERFRDKLTAFVNAHIHLVHGTIQSGTVLSMSAPGGSATIHAGGV